MYHTTDIYIYTPYKFLIYASTSFKFRKECFQTEFAAKSNSPLTPAIRYPQCLE